MKKWYHAMCVVRLGQPIQGKDENGDAMTIRGYVTNIGIPGLNIINAMMEAERIALSRYDGQRDGNHLEEVNIKSTDLESLRGQYSVEEKGLDGDPVFLSGRIFFDE